MCQLSVRATFRRLRYLRGLQTYRRTVISGTDISEIKITFNLSHNIVSVRTQLTQRFKNRHHFYFVPPEKKENHLISWIVCGCVITDLYIFDSRSAERLLTFYGAHRLHGVGPGEKKNTLLCFSFITAVIESTTLWDPHNRTKQDFKVIE